MRSIGALVLCLGVAGAARAESAAGGPTEASALAAGLSDLLSLIQDVPEDRWAGSARAHCHPNPGEDVSGDTDDPLEHPSAPYCSQCEVDAGAWKGSYFFYVDLDRDACTLQGAVLVGKVGGTDPPAALEALKPLVERRLAGLGPGARPKNGFVQERRSAGWEHTWHWGKRGATDADLYVTRPTPDLAPSVGFQWRRVPDDMRPAPIPRAALVGPNFLAACGEAGVRRGDLSAPLSIRKVLHEALARLHGSHPRDGGWPAIAACAYALAQRLVDVTPKGDRTTLGTSLGDPRLGLSYVDVGASWLLDVTLLRELALKRPDSRWGQQAFLAMMPYGFADRCCCVDGSDTFRAIIDHGERFLAAFPRSPVASEIEAIVAEAYETWWSLPLNSNKYLQAHAKNYAGGAEHARLEALRHFEKLPKPWSRDRRIAMFLLRHRLWAGMPYYCVYD